METTGTTQAAGTVAVKWMLATLAIAAFILGAPPDAAGADPWPGIKGVKSTFKPSGSNYGDIGSLIIKNNTDKPVSVTVPAGMLLNSSDPATQDLYIALVPTETPCRGAAYIGKNVTIKAGQSFVMEHMCGFCPDYEKAPPKKDDTTVYTCSQPDKKAATLLATIGLAGTIDASSLKLSVFAPPKAAAMMAQGALWMVDSKIDEVKDNEVSDKDLSDKFYGTFAVSAKASLDKMTPENRQRAETIVKSDISKIVAAISFVSKQRIPEKTTTRPRDDEDPGGTTPGETDTPGTTIEIGDPPTTNSIIDIHPIQVVQGEYEATLEKTPLIKDKRTMVRVFVQVSPIYRIKGVKCELEWNGVKHVVTGDLRAGKNGRTVVDNQSNRSNISLFAKDANWAYNFIFKKGKRFGEKMPKDLKLKATLFTPQNQKIATATESSGTHFRIRNARTFNVKVRFISRNGNLVKAIGKAAGAMAKAKAAHEPKIRNAILARYPIPESKLAITWLKAQKKKQKKKTEKKPAETTMQYFDRIATSLKADVVGADALLVITETATFKFPGKKPIVPLGWSPGNGKVVSDRIHFLFTDAKGYHEHTPPHEIGHQMRFFKKAHPTKKMNDAWDAGGYYAANIAGFGGGFVTTMSMAEGFNLMDVMGMGHHWISIQEYRLLCNRLTAP